MMKHTPDPQSQILTISTSEEELPLTFTSMTRPYIAVRYTMEGYVGHMIDLL